MLSKDAKKEAIRKFKEREPNRGVFAVRCRATGETWVDSSMDLGASRNSAWMFLRLGMYRNASVQAVWNAHGQGAFEYEVLERLDPEMPSIGVFDALKEAKRRWVERIGARPL